MMIAKIKAPQITRTLKPRFCFAWYRDSLFMKYLILLIYLCSFSSFADELTLVQGKTYTVPEGITWLVKNAAPASCRVCTADVYVSGGVSNVEVDGVIFSGQFDFSFSSKQHSEVKLHSGTEFFLGDTRSELVVYELEN